LAEIAHAGTKNGEVVSMPAAEIRGMPLLDRRTMLIGLALLLSGCTMRDSGGAGEGRDEDSSSAGTGTPPEQELNAAGIGIVDTLAARRSVRRFADTPVPDEDVALMLWAAQGVTDSVRGFRASPSAGALYPLELYAATGDGLSHYDADGGAVDKVSERDIRGALAAGSLAQLFVAAAPVVIVITGVYERTAHKYGDRAERYVHMEAGHAAQNIMLVATELGLGGTTVGAFVDEAIRVALGVDSEEAPLYVIPVGVPA
jgi:SagB-type dehydrogenase family enzyme